MSKRTKLALAVLGGAVAGCATGFDPGEPVIVAERIDCVEAAQVLGADVGNREIRIVNPVPGHYRFDDDVVPVELTLRPKDDRAHLEWSASLGVYGIIVERVAPRALRADEPAPRELAAVTRDPRAHLEWAEELGVYDVGLVRESELYLRDLSIAGPSLLPASLHPRTKAPLDIAALTLCIAER